MRHLQQIAIFIVCTTMLHFSLFAGDLFDDCSCGKDFKVELQGSRLVGSFLCQCEDSCQEKPVLDSDRLRAQGVATFKKGQCVACQRRVNLFVETLAKVYEEFLGAGSDDDDVAMGSDDEGNDDDEESIDSIDEGADYDMIDVEENTDGIDEETRGNNNIIIAPIVPVQNAASNKWEQGLISKLNDINERYKDLLASEHERDHDAKIKAKKIVGYVTMLAEGNVSLHIPERQCIPCNALRGVSLKASSSNFTGAPAHLCGTCSGILRYRLQEKRK